MKLWRWVCIMLGADPCIMCGNPVLFRRSLTCSLRCARELDMALGPHDVPSPKLTEVK